MSNLKENRTDVFLLHEWGLNHAKQQWSNVTGFSFGKRITTSRNSCYSNNKFIGTSNVSILTKRPFEDSVFLLITLFNGSVRHFISQNGNTVKLQIPPLLPPFFIEPLISQCSIKKKPIGEESELQTMATRGDHVVRTETIEAFQLYMILMKISFILTPVRPSGHNDLVGTATPNLERKKKSLIRSFGNSFFWFFGGYKGQRRRSPCLLYSSRVSCTLGLREWLTREIIERACNLLGTQRTLRLTCHQNWVSKASEWV